MARKRSKGDDNDGLIPPEPGEGPAVETEAEGSLRRIAEGHRHREEKRAAMLAAKASYKAAKADYEEAVEELDQITSDQCAELPLFPRFGGTAPPPTAPPAADIPPKGPPPGRPGAKTDDEAWKNAWLSSLALPTGVVIRLGEAGLQTVGDLAAYTENGGNLTEIAGIGAAKAQEIEDALMRFWERRGADDDKRRDGA